MRKVIAAALLITVLLIIQLIKIDRPFFGHFSSYQIVSAFMARNMIRENFSEILLPKSDVLINGKKSLELNQYPFHSLLAALGVKIFGGSLEFWGRFQAITANLGAIILLGLIGAALFNPSVGWATAILYGFSPFSVIYGQSFMSESISFLCLLAAFYLLIRKKNGLDLRGIIASGILLSVSFVGRVHFAIILPAVLIASYKCSATKKGIRSLLLFALAMLLPCLWYGYTFYVSAGSDHVHSNLFLQLADRKSSALHYIKNPGYFLHVIQILGLRMMTPIGLALALSGIILMTKKKSRLALALAGMSFAGLILLIPQKINDHEFYLYPMVPFSFLTAGYSAVDLLSRVSRKKELVLSLCFLIYTGISARLFMHPLWTYPPHKDRIIPIAEIVKEKTNANDTLIVGSYGFSEITYYSDRRILAFSLSGIDRPLPYYFKQPKFSKLNYAEMNQLEEAMKDPVTWLEYLKNQGGDYFVSDEKPTIDEFPALISHLRSQFHELSRSEDDFYLFATKKIANDI